jgi:hypothetical protein
MILLFLFWLFSSEKEDFMHEGYSRMHVFVELPSVNIIFAALETWDDEKISNGRTIVCAVKHVSVNAKLK